MFMHVHVSKQKLHSQEPQLYKAITIQTVISLHVNNCCSVP